MKKFDLRLFLGKWYEVARINNGFEPEMDKVTAQYNLNDNGTIQVINSGYIGDKKRQIVGTAKTTDQSNLLKVSFFPGIYSDYKILAIGNNYDYALIGGVFKSLINPLTIPTTVVKPPMYLAAPSETPKITGEFCSCAVNKIVFVHSRLLMLN